MVVAGVVVAVVDVGVDAIDGSCCCCQCQGGGAQWEETPILGEKTLN